LRKDGTTIWVKNNIRWLEAFSDGVFAIAITLLILEIKVPQIGLQSEPRTLFEGLVKLWPSYFGYVLSFVTIGIYWVRHHFLFMIYEKTDYWFKWLNLLFLMWISFLPFPTEVLARYMQGGSTRDERTAVAFYAIGLTLICWTLMWLYASYRHRLIDPRLAPQFLRHVTTHYVVSVALFCITISLSLIEPNLGLAVCVGVTLYYLLPPKPPVYVPNQS
jgi:uncharacterized membrane protein